MVRTMINETNVAKHFWVDTVNTTCYIQNMISIRPISVKNTYELWKNVKPNISYLHSFGCSCFILNTKENMCKFNSKAHECIMLGHSEHSKVYKVYNTETQIVEESTHARFDDNLNSEKLKLVEKFVDLEITDSGSEDNNLEAKEAEAKDFESPWPEVVEAQNPLRRNRHISSYFEELIMGDKSKPVRTISSFKPPE